VITIKQLADELGVSKQAVYNRVTKNPLKDILAAIDNAVQPSAQGTIYLSKEGAEVVRSAYLEKPSRPAEPQKAVTKPKLPMAAEPANKTMDALIIQVGSIQKAVNTLLDYTLARDAKINALETQLSEKNAKIEDLAMELKSKYTKAEDLIHDFKKQLQQPETKTLRVEEPVISEKPQTVEQPPKPKEPPKADDPPKTENPPKTEVPPPEAPSEPVIVTEEKPDTSYEESFTLLEDLFEPLVNLSGDDFDSPTLRFAKLLTQ